MPFGQQAHQAQVVPRGCHRRYGSVGSPLPVHLERTAPARVPGCGRGRAHAAAAHAVRSPRAPRHGHVRVQLAPRRGHLDHEPGIFGHVRRGLGGARAAPLRVPRRARRGGIRGTRRERHGLGRRDGVHAGRPG